MPSHCHLSDPCGDNVSDYFRCANGKWVTRKEHPLRGWYGVDAQTNWWMDGALHWNWLALV